MLALSIPISAVSSSETRLNGAMACMFAKLMDPSLAPIVESNRVFFNVAPPVGDLDRI